MASKEIIERSNALIKALREQGYEPKSYSGRGMFGKSCISLHDESAWDIAKVLFNEEYDGEFDALPEPNSDSMGLGRVIYWPSYPWPDGDDDE